MMIALAGWENFYVIVGSSAGALIGLQFVAIALIADMPVSYGTPEAGDAFATPTIVHFGVALLLSAILSAPWHVVTAPSVLWGLLGFGGLVYEIIVARRMRTQKVYRPEFEDWLFHVLLPFVAYAALAATACAALSHPHASLYGVGAAALLLLFIGIHNAWDAVTYHVFVVRKRGQHGDGPNP
jgi:hypothetical protein